MADDGRPKVSTLRYLVALIFPPLALLMCGHIFLFLISILLMFGCYSGSVPIYACYFPAALISMLVVSAYNCENHFELSYLKIYKSHMNAMNAVLKEEAKIHRATRKAMEAEARDKRADRKAQVAASKPPRRPIVTWAGIRSAGLMAKEMAVLTKDLGVRSYRGLPEWAHPITWGLAVGTPLSLAFVVMVLMRGHH